jgi:hypothetical protein
MEELKNVTLLFYSDYWDGPLCGLALYENQYYYYVFEEWGFLIKEAENDDEDDEWSPRTWKLYKLEPWQLTYELYWHALFCTNEATYTSFDRGSVNDRFKIKNKFYKKQKKEHEKIDYSQNECIGWVNDKNILLDKKFN